MLEEVTAVPDAAPKFLSDAIVLSQYNQPAASSLPESENAPTDNQVPEAEGLNLPDASVPATSPEDQSAAADSANEDSFDLPDLSLDSVTAPPKAEGQPEAAKHADSPLTESDPEWQHDAYDRLKSDADISEEEKRSISKLHPSNWDRMREWSKSHKLIGKYRNSDYPMDKVVEDLSKHSASRYAALQTEVVNRIVADPEQLIQFAEQHPQTYSQLIVGLVQAQPEVIGQILSYKGFSVVKDETLNVDVDTLKQELMADEDWVVLEGTGVETKVQKLLESVSAMKQKLAEVAPEVKTKEQGGAEDAAQSAPSYQDAAINVVNSWESDVEKGIRAAGIVPPTEEERKMHPSAARIKEIAYLAAVHGIPGKLPAWQEQLFIWGEAKREGFKERTDEIARLVRESSESEALSYAKSVKADAYELGRLRASIPYIKNMYSDASRLMNRPPQETAPGEKPKESVGTSTGVEAKGTQSGFVSDKIILGMLGK
jgi:hypothetical protein